MDIIAMVNEKGGTGKTTSTVNLAAALGEKGKKVLLVDLDGQAATTRWLGVEGDTRFAEALLAGKGLEPIRDIMPNVDLAPGHGKLDSVAHDLRPTQGGQLRKLLGRIEGYDYCLIDCPPSLGNRLIGNALLAATHALVPVETSVLALDGLKILLTTLEDIREGFGHNITLLGVLGCRYDGRTRLSRLVLEELQRALPNHLFDTVIRENVKMRECPASGQSILSYAGDSHGAQDYRALAAEVIQRLVQLQPNPETARKSTEGLRSAVSKLEEVAEEIEHVDAHKEHIPDIDGRWSSLGEALATDKPVDDPRSPDEDEQEAEAAPAAEPEPAEALVNEPEPVEPEPVEPEPQPAPEPACEPEPVAEAPQPPAPAEPSPVECASHEEPEPAALQPETPRSQTPLYNVTAVMSADEARDDLASWPAETDVIQAEQAVDGQELKSWPESEDFEDQVEELQSDSEDGKKVPTWLRFFTGSRD
jgi:chromosome partitioning protein